MRRFNKTPFYPTLQFRILDYIKVRYYQYIVSRTLHTVIKRNLTHFFRSSYDINWIETDLSTFPTSYEGFRQNTDQISLYLNPNKTRYSTLFRESYSSSSDTARLCIISDRDDRIYLHDANIVIEDFDMEIQNHNANGKPLIHKSLIIYCRARYRFPLFNSSKNNFHLYEKTSASIKFTYSLRCR